MILCIRTKTCSTKNGEIPSNIAAPMHVCGVVCKCVGSQCFDVVMVPCFCTRQNMGQSSSFCLATTLACAHRRVCVRTFSWNRVEECPASDCSGILDQGLHEAASCNAPLHSLEFAPKRLDGMAMRADRAAKEGSVGEHELWCANQKR